MNVKHVNVTEVGPRDGFQSEKTILRTEDKIKIINNLIDEEILYREALILGLEQEDKIIKKIYNYKKIYNAHERTQYPNKC